MMDGDSRVVRPWTKSWTFLVAVMPALMLPALPFTILMPALSLLLVFRTNLCQERSGLGLGLGLG